MNIIINLTTQEKEMRSIKTGNSNIKLLLWRDISGNHKRIDKKNCYDQQENSVRHRIDDNKEKWKEPQNPSVGVRGKLYYVHRRTPIKNNDA